MAALTAALLSLAALAGAPTSTAAPHWTAIDFLPEQILDVDPDRVLYLSTTPTFDAPGTIALKDRHTDEVTPIDLGDNASAYGGFLTPYGVVIAVNGPTGVGGIYEWRDGTLTRHGNMSGLHLKVASHYVLWGHLQNPSFGPLHLFRMDLDDGTTVALTTEGSSGGQHDSYDDWASNDLAANGDVAMWTFDGISRYRNGVTTQLDPGGDSDAGFAAFPRTDGTNVVWRRWACCDRGSLRGYGPTGSTPEGEFVLDAFTDGSTAKEPSPDYDYRVNAGWTAFTKGGEFVETVWTRDRSGVETAVSPPGGYEITGLDENGEVVYGTYDEGRNNQTSYLARPAEDPVEIGKTWDNQRSGRGFSNHVFKAGDHWYSIAFGSLRRLQLTDAPVDGSQTEIVSGPEGVDHDYSPTFEFSSTVAGATFECRLGDDAWRACSSPHTYPSLAEGEHTFLVRSVAPGGQVDPEPASQAWTIDDEPPSEFSLLDPVDDAKTSDRTPTLSWQPANDAESGVDHYSVWIDRNRVADVQATQFTPPALADGWHVWRVEAVDANGNARASVDRTFKIDTTPPAASLHASPSPVLTGDAVVLDAAGTNDAGGGAVVRYEWDLDGDGGFERDTGAASNTSTAYFTPGEMRPAVRVTDDVGHTSTASTPLSVRPAPPTGRVGVSIDDGARFTNDVHVKVSVVWPALASHVLLSNDGGFRDVGKFAVNEEVPWTIDSAGSRRLPRTIYARFEGIARPETYQDDVILDDIRPRVIVAKFASRIPARSSPRASARRTYRLRIKGREDVSGLRRMQIATNRKRPGATRRYRNFAKVKASSSRIYVRVQDGAENWSRWKRVGR